MKRLSGLLVLLAILIVLLVPGSTLAASSCDTFGCFTQGPVKPWGGISDWYQGHTSDTLPPAGCRWLEGSSRGTYPAFKVTLSPLKFKWITSYQFHARLTMCWTASGWTIGQEYNATGRKITKTKVDSWWSDRASVTKTESQVQVRRSDYYSCVLSGQTVSRGCVDITVEGQASIAVPAGLPFGTMQATPWIKFRGIAADGTYKEVPHDYSIW